MHARVAAGDFARHFRAFLLENPHYPPDSAAAFCRRFTDRFVRHFQNELEGAGSRSAAGKDDMASWAPQSDATSLEEEAVSPLSLSGGDVLLCPASKPSSARSAAEHRGCERFQDSYGQNQGLPPSSSSSCCSSVGGANGRREERSATLASGNGEVPVEEEEEEEDSWLGGASVGEDLENADSAHQPSSLSVTPPPGPKDPPPSSKHKLKKRFSLRSVGRSVRGSVRGILHWRSSSSDSAHSQLPSSYSYTLGVQDAAAGSSSKRSSATQPPTPTSALPVSLSMPLSLPHSSSSSLPPSSSSSAASLAVVEGGRDPRRSNGEEKDKWSHRLEKLRLTRSPPPALGPAAALPPAGAVVTVAPPRKGRLVREGAVCVSSSADDLSAAHGFSGFSFGLLHHSLDAGPAQPGPAHPPGAAGSVPFRGGRWHKCRLVLRGRDGDEGHGEEYYLEFFIPPKVSLLRGSPCWPRP